VLVHGAWHYQLGGWLPPWGIEYVIDPLAGGMALLIGGMALPAVLYAGPALSGWPAGQVGAFYSLFLLLVTGLLGMVVTGDLFNLYVFLEISSLAAYALLASGGIRAVVATFRYLLIGTIAATFYLLGVGYLYALTGTLNMADLTALLPTIVTSRAFVVAVAFVAIGLAIKAALFPLHGWLPDVYTYAPASVSGFIAAVMAKVSAYALLRVFVFVLQTEGAAGQALFVLHWTSVVATLAGSILALAQQDLRRMLAYSSVGQMATIVLGMALGTHAALQGALLHMLNHAVMKGCLFLAVGGVQWRTGHTQLAGLVGISQRMPLTMAAFAVAAGSMIGIPPTAGFFSKWYLLTGALEAQAWSALLVLVLSSVLSMVYFFRVLEVAYLRQPAAPVHAPRTRPRRPELPWSMLLPIVLLATLVVLLGVWNQVIVTQVIQYALPRGVVWPRT
jgi:multicomponent Na+:H+ antiporter subunit D